MARGDTIVLESRRPGARDWSVRNRGFRSHSENLDKQRQVAEEFVRQWRAVEPDTQFRILDPRTATLSQRRYF